MVDHNPSRHTILLIKPNRSLARITGRALQDHRFVVTQAPAAAEALEVLGTQYPDAVVLDSDLTNGASGMVLDRLRQLGQRGRPSPVWIVILSLDRRDVVRQYGPSIPHFLAKPFDPWDLIRLKEILVG